MKRSVPAFVSGLIIYLCIGIACSLLFALFAITFGLIIGLGGKTAGFIDFIYALVGICVIANVAGIVGATVCLTNKKAGGIIMSVSAATDVFLAVTIIILSLLSATEESPVNVGSIVLLIIAALASVVPPILAFIPKKNNSQPITDKF